MWHSCGERSPEAPPALPIYSRSGPHVRLSYRIMSCRLLQLGNLCLAVNNKGCSDEASIDLGPWNCLHGAVFFPWLNFVDQYLVISYSCFSLVIITWFGLLSLSLTSAKSLSLWSESLCRLIDCNEIWRIHKDGWDLTGSRKRGAGNQPNFTDRANKIKKGRSQMTWQRFALPSSMPDPNINFPTVWNSCVERGGIHRRRRIGMEASRCFCLRPKRGVLWWEPGFL